MTSYGSLLSEAQQVIAGLYEGKPSRSSTSPPDELDRCQLMVPAEHAHDLEALWTGLF